MLETSKAKRKAEDEEHLTQMRNLKAAHLKEVVDLETTFNKKRSDYLSGKSHSDTQRDETSDR